MLNKSYLLATLAGFIVAFFGGWLIFGKLLMDTQMANTIPYEGLMRSEDQMVWWAIIVSNLVWVAFTAYVFQNWANISTFQGGLIAGATISAFMSIAIDTGFYAMMNLWTTTYIIIDIIANIVFGALIGGVVGWVLGRTAQS